MMYIVHNTRYARLDLLHNRIDFGCSDVVHRNPFKVYLDIFRCYVPKGKSVASKH